jgi:hypothetical protein
MDNKLFQLLALLAIVAIVYWYTTRLTLPAPVRMVIDLAIAVVVILVIVRFFGVHIPGI